jgi:hypothetical protein
MPQDLIREFADPGPAYRGKPFWCWNGELDRDELLRQIHVIGDMGWGGFFMHSRTGLATEYLGDEWFELINACADEGEALGLEAWLYDEDRWPSGTAGGIVTRDPQYRMHYLRLTPVPGAQFTWRDDLVAAFACHLEGIDCFECRRLSATVTPEELQGLTVLVFTVEEMACSSFYNGETYLDTLSAGATARFLQVTHEQYLARCGDRLGRSIRGIFTDEPHRGLVMCGSGHVNPDSQWLVPWTARLLPTFKARFGYDLADHLPAIFLRLEGRRLDQVKWHFMEHLQQLFLDNWARPCDEWCRRHGLILTGHVLHEDTLGAQSVTNGSMMRYYEHMEYPGVDVLTEGNRAYWIVKQCASVARQLGRPWLLSELYGCTGWQMPFSAHKAVGDWQALFGVTLRCPHLSWYTMAGEAKRDFPGSIFHQSAWWREYKHVEDYFSRIHVAMSQGTPCCDVLVLSPVESAWAQVHTGWAMWLDSVDPDVKRLDAIYADLFHWLCGAQIDFDYGDENHLARLSALDATGKVPALTLGKGRYRAVIVAGMETIRATTLERLAAFADAGGTVIFAGPPPSHVDALPSDWPARLAQRATRVGLERDSLVAAVATVAPPVARVHTPEGDLAAEVFCQARETPAGRFLLALNTNREAWLRGATVALQGTGTVEEWDCATGERHRLAAREQDGWTLVALDFPPSGEHLLLLAATPTPGSQPRVEWQTLGTSQLAGPYEYELDEPNVCVLDRARFRLGEGDWQPEAEILKVDRAVRTALGLPLRGGEMLQPWFSGTRPPGRTQRLALEFDFEVAGLPDSEVELALETPEAFALSLNGAPLPAPLPGAWWVDACFRCIVVPSRLLRQGTNVLRLETDFHDGVNLEALFLLGGFGVRLEGTRRILGALPATLEAGNLVPQGLPFYSGRVTYLLPPQAAPAGAGRALLRLGAHSAACSVVRRPAGDAVLGWEPYEAALPLEMPAAGVPLEVVLTRRNTFGPLHQVPLYAAGYSPESFVTEGPAWTDEYALIPSGLLEAPVLDWQRET